MNLAAEAPLWLALILAVLLVAAAVEDAARLRISNLTSGLILLTGIAVAVIAGPELDLWKNLAVLAGLLVAGMPLFAAGKFGGGDVKLFAATGFWFDPWGALYMVAAVFIAGGVLALLILFLRTIGWGEAALRRVQVLRPKSGIPYGVAIAIGALISIAMQRGAPIAFNL